VKIADFGLNRDDVNVPNGVVSGDAGERSSEASREVGFVDANRTCMIIVITTPCPEVTSLNEPSTAID
jgi:hypothetical protein